jgi:mechanosensitive ion channel-like protein
MWEQVSQALDQSLTRVMTRIASLLPGFLALLVALLVSSLVAWAIGFVLRRSLKSLDFDRKATGWGLPGFQSEADRSPTDWVVRIVSWSIIFVGFLVGVTAFEATLTSRLVSQLFAYLPNLAAAVIVLLVGGAAARFFSRSVLIGAVNLNVQYAHLLSVGLKWLILVLTGAMALNHLEIGGKIVDEAFAILFGGIVLTLALAVGLGARDLVSRSLERQADKLPEQNAETFRHF